MNKEVNKIQKFKSTSIPDLSVLNMSNFDSFGVFPKNEFDSVISNPQSKFFPFSSFEFFDFSIPERMVKLANLSEFGSDSSLSFDGQARQFFFCPGMEEVSEHKDGNYLADFTRCLTRLSTSSIGIQELSRSASLTRSSVSRIASGVDHSIKSIISSSNSLERTFGGANTPRRFFSSMIVRDENLSIQDYDNNLESNVNPVRSLKLSTVKTN